MAVVCLPHPDSTVPREERRIGLSRWWGPVPAHSTRRHARTQTQTHVRGHTDLAVCARWEFIVCHAHGSPEQ